jgi:uncharacterized protein involved in exopolysaccharide biosynthesis
MPLNSGDEFAVIEILTVLLRFRWLIVGVPAVLVVGAILTSISQPRLYSATASFATQAPSRPGGAGAASLARQFGLDLGEQRAGQSPEFYARVLTGRELLWQVATAEYQISEGSRSADLITLLELDKSDGAADREMRRRMLEVLRERIAISIDRDTGIMTVRTKFASPLLAEQVADRMIEAVNAFNLNTRQSQARAEGEFVERRLLEAEQELKDAEAELQAFLRQNRMFQNSPELVFEHGRLERQVVLRQDLTTSLRQAKEQARIDAVRDTPVITLIEAAAGSARPEARGTVARAVLAGISGVALAILLAFLLEFLRRSRQDNRNAYREFNALRQATINDLKRPFRRFYR